MRRRSFTGPLLLLLIGAFFLWHNLHPEAPLFDMAAQYWPFVLIAWGLLRLIEVVALGHRGSTFTGGEIVLVVFICIVGSGLWEGHQHGIRYDFGGMVIGESFDYPVSAQAPAAGMTRITFDNPRGNIKVTGADTQEVTVTGRKEVHAWNRNDADQMNGNTPVEIVPQGDRLLIRTNQDRAQDSNRINDDLEVTVPLGMTVEARGRTGDIEVNDVAGDVEVVTSRADVRLARIGGNARLEVGHSEVVRAIDVKGKLDLQGRGSDVSLENVAGQVTINGAYSGALEFKNLAKPLQFEGAFNTELHVQGVPGRLNMDRSEVTANGLTGPVRLVTRSRDVKLEQFTQSLELETEHGDVELTPSSPMPSIDARSGYGRIDLVLPDKSSFDLQATAERGEAVNDFGPQIQKEVEGRRATLKGRVGDGPSIRLTANRGSVSVRKEGMPASEIPDVPPGKTPKVPLPPKPPAEVKM
jgi:Putative adhesin